MNTHFKKSILAVLIIIGISLSSFTQAAEYGGGSGTVDEPYEIWTPEQMNTIGLNSRDWDKHFRLMADIDMSAYTGTQYNIIGNATTRFSGTFDGNGHIIRNLTYTTAESVDNVGLFGMIAQAAIKSLGIDNILISTNGNNVGGLVGHIVSSNISFCYVTGSVTGNISIGGLVGLGVGQSVISSCYMTGSVCGDSFIGGLVGSYHSYTDSPILIRACYAACSVSGIDYHYTGGLLGWNDHEDINSCFWDIEVSGQSGSAAGKGLTTEQMKTISIFQNANWANKGWVMADGMDYPRLSWEDTGWSPIPEAVIPFTGSGIAGDPYLISTAEEFALLSWYTEVLDKQIRLTTNLDLSGFSLHPVGDLGLFAGVFDGMGNTISNAVVQQSNSDHIGLFSIIGRNGRVINLGVENVNVTGKHYVGGLAGLSFGTVTACYTNGSVVGSSRVGGLLGESSGTIMSCYSNSSASGSLNFIGGLVGYMWSSDITINCYSTGLVSGDGADYVGGLVGHKSWSDVIVHSFWDTEISGLTSSAGGTGITTAEMQTLSTYTDAGWDFVGESINGTDNIWRMCLDGIEYPKLSWEFSTIGDFTCPDGVNIEDLIYLASEWMTTGPSLADTNFDQEVNYEDLAVLSSNWLTRRTLLTKDFSLDENPNWMTEGEWEFGQPLGFGGTSYGNPDPNSGYTGVNVYGINLNGDFDTAVGGPYYLTTYPIDCRHFDSVKVSFMSWPNIDSSNYAQCSFEVSENGTDWVVLWNNTPEPITDDDWNKMEFDISEYADDNPTLYLRWGYEVIDRAYPYSGWNIDDIELWGTL